MDESEKDKGESLSPEEVPPGGWTTPCPECGESIPGKWAQCPNYSFDLREAALRAAAGEAGKSGIAYSGWADLALFVGQIASILGCISAIVYTVFQVFKEKYAALYLGPFAFFYSLALYVVFTRVGDMSKER
jgi:hypothetical protein